MIKKGWKGIVAVDENLGIGLEDRLPWDSGDLSWFRECTMGQNVLFGRNTFLSLPVLWGRKVFVMTSDPPHISYGSTMKFDDEEVKFCEVTQISNGSKIPQNCWIAGGMFIYDRYLPFCDKLYVTRMKGKFRCDTFLNDFTADFDHHTTLKENESFKIELWLNKSI